MVKLTIDSHLTPATRNLWWIDGRALSRISGPSVVPNIDRDKSRMNSARAMEKRYQDGNYQDRGLVEDPAAKFDQTKPPRLLGFFLSEVQPARTICNRARFPAR